MSGGIFTISVVVPSLATNNHLVVGSLMPLYGQCNRTVTFSGTFTGSSGRPAPIFLSSGVSGGRGVSRSITAGSVCNRK